jgi:hypothetical protein
MTDAAGNSATCTFVVVIEVGDCLELGGGQPPVPQPSPPPPAPCQTSDGGLNLLMSLLFHAPVCGMACPLAMTATLCGMMLLRQRTTHRRRRR